MTDTIQAKSIRKIATGARLLVFDSRLFIDDVTTPLSMTMQPCTVTRGNYSKRSSLGYVEHDLIDVRFDRDGKESRAHFAASAEEIA